MPRGSAGATVDASPTPAKLLPAALPPRLDDASVDRPSLLARLDAAATGVVVVRAPAGFGKTTLLRQWVAQDGRPAAWLTLGRDDDDPVVLLGHLVHALAGVVALPRASVGAGAGVDAGLRALADDLAAVPEPFVLVLDDVQELTTPGSVDALDRFLDLVPARSKVLVGTRADPGVRTVRRRLAGTLTELDASMLRFDEHDSAVLLRRACPGIDDRTAELATARCDGWAAGLTLVALALRGADDPERVARGLSLADRPAAEYLRDEVLGRMSESERRFIVRTAVLDHLCSGLCDEMLDAVGSHAMLERLASSGNLFVTSLDDGGTWYRYHAFWRDLLLLELRSAGGDEAGLRRRAAGWLERHGFADAAVRQYLAAGDRVAAARLVGREIGACFTEGRMETAQRWLESFDEQEVRSNPDLVPVAVWVELVRGGPEGLRPWLERMDDLDPATRMPDGSSLEVARAAVVLLSGEGGNDETIRAADLLVARPAEAREWWASARVVGVAARYACGRLDDPEAAFLAAAHDVRSSPGPRALALAHAGLVAFRAHAVEVGHRRISEAHAVAHAAGFDGFAPLVMVRAVRALDAAYRQDRDELRDGAATVDRQLAEARALGPRGHVHVRLVMAEAWRRAGEPERARALLDAAGGLLERMPEAVVLAAWHAELEARAAGSGPDVPHALTAAELRILDQLPTHRSLREIAELHFVSRNTVKTQALAVYRKLGVTNRSDAVLRARELGLLDG